MIARLHGTLVSVSGMDIVIDCGGVGYAVSVPLSTADQLPRAGENVTVHTVLNVREDAMQLFGFLTTSERSAFTLLTSITGIGGRTALGILSASSIADLRRAVTQGNLIALQRLPGVGKKTAERMVVELREKILAIEPEVGSPQHEAVSGDSTVEEALGALVSLGYSRAAAEKAVRAVIAVDPTAITSSESLIRKALRQAASM